MTEGNKPNNNINPYSLDPVKLDPDGLAVTTQLQPNKITMVNNNILKEEREIIFRQIYNKKLLHHLFEIENILDVHTYKDMPYHKREAKLYELTMSLDKKTIGVEKYYKLIDLHSKIKFMNMSKKQLRLRNKISDLILKNNKVENINNLKDIDLIKDVYIVDQLINGKKKN